MRYVYEDMSRRIAVCLVSGGLDSTVAATLVKQERHELYLLSIKYGQKLIKELEYARRVANFFKPVEYKIIDIDGFKDVSFSPLTGDSDIPKDRDLSKPAVGTPLIYPPGRDPFILVLAATWAESLWLADVNNISEAKVIIGTNAYDSSAYPDCSPEFYKRFNELLRVSTKMGRDYGKFIEVATPLIDKSKNEVVKLGLSIDAPLKLTWSCYEGGEKACGRCDACKLRLAAFAAAGEKDAVKYDSGVV